MALTTAFTELFGPRHPIALAPVGGSAGGLLAAAVSRGGGLGMLGAGTVIGTGWLVSRRSWWPTRPGREGIGFLTWAIEVNAVEFALEHNPRAVMISLGDPSPFVELIHRSAAARIATRFQTTDEALLDPLVARVGRLPETVGERGYGPGVPGTARGTSGYVARVG